MQRWLPKSAEKELQALELLLHPNVASQCLGTEITKISTYSPAGPRAVQENPTTP